MRWLFLFVFSLNLAYIAWQLNLPAATAYTSVEPFKGVAPIVLLAELESSAETVLTPVETAESAEETPDERLVNTAKKTTTKTASKQVKETVVALAETEAEAEAEATLQSPKTEKIVIAPNAKEKLVEEQVDEKAKLQQSKPDSCFTLGPFRDLKTLRTLSSEIKTYVVASGFRGREEKETPLYWVNIKPAKNNQQAAATGKRLKKKKIKDFYIIRDGENKNGISLGYYRNKDGAQGLTNKVKNLGFAVVLEEVQKTYTVYWLDYRLTPGSAVPEKIFSKHIRPADKITRLSRQCDLV